MKIIRKALVLLLGLALLALGLAFSLLLLVFVGVVLAVLLLRAYFHRRKVSTNTNAPPGQRHDYAANDRVFEGEAVVVEEWHSRQTTRSLSDSETADPRP